jgi:hypothetical protein
MDGRFSVGCPISKEFLEKLLVRNLRGKLAHEYL